MEFHAHSTDRPDRSDWQPLQEHLINVGELARQRAEWFGGETLAQAAGILHDLGKYTSEFQLRLAGQHPRMDHATWGARIACQRYGPVGHLIAYAIAGHHAGLANGKGGIARGALHDRLLAKPEHALLPEWENELTLPGTREVAPPGHFVGRPERSMFQLSMLGRMLFSCLVDADYTDTGHFYRRIEGKPERPTDLPPRLEQLRDVLNQHMAEFSTEGGVNALRGRVLAHVRAQAELTPGLFSLTVPTGGGKTLASLSFALDHAIRHGMRRVIFVIPFTSIVEQNAAVFRKALGALGDAAVLEHHSAFVDDRNSEPQSKEKLQRAMESWNAPIIVTTAVQFFESLFADRPSRCRKLHNIAGSVVILDEAQTMPLKLLRPCVTAIDELALNYRTSIVLCTATQPALNAGDDFPDGLRNVRELAPDPPALYRQLKRVQIRHVGLLEDDELAAHLRAREQVLCIVNNRRHARKLFEDIADLPGARHLTTLMCAKHRSEVLAGIRQQLLAGEPCRVVSTSLIEAGVDADFPTVLRAEAGLDSIAQAAGRCNREGRRNAEISEVLVFATANPDWAPPPELQQFSQVFREIQRHHDGDLLALDAVRDYFHHLYWQQGPLALDAHALLGLLRDAQLDSLPFETLAAEFRMIETTMLPVIVPYDDKAQKSLGALKFATGCGAIARDLQPYLVQVPRQGYVALRQAGAIQPIAPERYEEQFMQLVNPDLYHERFGLHWDDPSFIRAENLVI